MRSRREPGFGLGLSSAIIYRKIMSMEVMMMMSVSGKDGYDGYKCFTILMLLALFQLSYM